MNIFTKVPGLAQQTRYVCGAFGNKSNTKFCGLSFNQTCTSQEGCINQCRKRHIKVRPTSMTHCGFVEENTYVVQITSIRLGKPWNNILLCFNWQTDLFHAYIVMEQIKCNFNWNVNSSKSYVFYWLLSWHIFIDWLLYMCSLLENMLRVLDFFPLASWGLCSNVPSTGPVGG